MRIIDFSVISKDVSELQRIDRRVRWPDQMPPHVYDIGNMSFGVLSNNDWFTVSHHPCLVHEQEDSEVLQVSWEFSGPGGLVYGFVYLSEDKRILRFLKGKINVSGRVPFHRVILCLYLGISLEGFAVHHTVSTLTNHVGYLVAVRKASHDAFHRSYEKTAEAKGLLDLPKSIYEDLEGTKTYLEIRFKGDTLSGGYASLSNREDISIVENNNQPTGLRESVSKRPRNHDEIRGFGYSRKITLCIEEIIKLLNIHGDNTRKRTIEGHFSAKKPQKYGLRTVESALSFMKSCRLVTSTSDGRYSLTEWAFVRYSICNAAMPRKARQGPQRYKDPADKKRNCSRAS